MTLIAAFDRAATVAARLGGLAIGAAAVVVGIDVVLRKITGITFGSLDEVAGYVFGVTSVWAFSHALIARAHIRIDTAYVWMPRPVQAALDIVSLVVLTGLAGCLAWFGYEVVAETVRLGAVASTPLRTPLAWPQIPWFLGLLFFFLTCVVMLATCLWHLIRGRLDVVRRLGGAPSLNDEVDAAIEEVEVSQSPSGTAR